jgi:hypothetical protein
MDEVTPPTDYFCGMSLVLYNQPINRILNGISCIFMNESQNFNMQSRVLMKRWINSMAFLLVIISCMNMACSFDQSEPGIDKNKFAKLQSAALEVKASIDAGESYQQVADKTVIFADRITTMKYVTSSKREERLLDAYRDLLVIYRDGLLLWKYLEYFPHLAPELKGRIYVAQDVDPIVEKYHFQTKSHVYEPTGQIWKSISAESIRTVWKDADAELASINNITNY